MTDELESCAVCGFVWDVISPPEIAPRMIAAMEFAAGLLEVHSKNALLRRTPDQWSAVEYGCHMRDVLYNIRDKMVLITVEENPQSLPLHGVPRVELGLYRHEDPQTLAVEMRLAGALFTRTFDALPQSSHNRMFLYRYPREAMRNLIWVAAQALHESEHHAADIRQVLSN